MAFLISFAILTGSILSAALILNENPGTEQGYLKLNIELFMHSYLHFIFSPESETFRRLVYYPPWCRISTFIIGIILGYVLYQEKSSVFMTKLNLVCFNYFLNTSISFILNYIFSRKSILLVG